MTDKITHKLKNSNIEKLDEIVKSLNRIDMEVAKIKKETSSSAIAKKLGISRQAVDYYKKKGGRP